MIEPKLKNLIEVNCAVAKIKGKTVATQLEKPLTKGEILDFSDKYMMFGKRGPIGFFRGRASASRRSRTIQKRFTTFFRGAVRCVRTGLCPTGSLILTK